MNRLTERTLEKNPHLDPASVEAGVKVALEAGKDLLYEATREETRHDN